MEPWRAVDAHSGGVEAQSSACLPVVADSHHFAEDQNLARSRSAKKGKSNPDPH
jgi:hypothetical protein